MRQMRRILSAMLAAVLWVGSVPIVGLAAGGGAEKQLPVQLLEADADGDGIAEAKGFSTLTEALAFVEKGFVIPAEKGVIHLEIKGDIQDKGYVCDLSDNSRIRKVIIQGVGADGEAVRIDTSQTTAPKDSNKAEEFDIVLEEGGELEIANLIFPHNMVFDAVSTVSDHSKKVYVHDCTFYGTWNPVKACVSGEYRFENNRWKDFQGYCVWIKTEGSKEISYDFIFEKNDVRRYRVFNSATDNKAADCGIVNVTMLDNSFVHEREYTQETGSCMALCQISGWINGKIDVERNTMIGYYLHRNCTPALLVQYNPYTSGIKDGSYIIIKDNLMQCDIVGFSYYATAADKSEELGNHGDLSSEIGDYTAIVENNALVHMYPEASSTHNVEDHCHVCNICEQTIVNITTDGHGVIADSSIPAFVNENAESFSEKTVEDESAEVSSEKTVEDESAEVSSGKTVKSEIAESFSGKTVESKVAESSSSQINGAEKTGSSNTGESEGNAAETSDKAESNDIAERKMTGTLTASSRINTTGAGSVYTGDVRKSTNIVDDREVETFSGSLPSETAGENTVSDAASKGRDAGVFRTGSNSGSAGTAEGAKKAGAAGEKFPSQAAAVSERKTENGAASLSDADMVLRTFAATEDKNSVSPASIPDAAVVSDKTAVIVYNYQDSAKDYVPDVKRDGIVVDVDKEKVLTAIPNPGYELSDFLVNGESVKDELDQDADGHYYWTFCNYGGLERCQEIHACFTRSCSFAPEDDTIVLDYGLAVALTDEKADWNIYANDNLNGCQAVGVKFDASMLKYGMLVEQNEIYYYKPTAIMQKQEKISYTVTQLQVNGEVVPLSEEEQETKEITIVPASIVFYEPDVLADKKSDITINANKVQNVMDNEIGYDAVYAATADNGKCVEVAFDEQGEKGRDRGFRFTFTGIGADIIGVTSTQSGKLAYYVTDETGMAVQVGVIDSYYSANGEAGIEQVPVAALRMSQRGTYTVTVNIHEAGITAHDREELEKQSAEEKRESNGTAPAASKEIIPIDEFILQGIRIYNTMTKEQYYELDSSRYFQEIAEIVNVREVLENTQAAILSMYTNEGLEAYGVTIVENMEDMTVDMTDELTDYLKRGPGNEVYLGEHMAYAFVAEIEDTSKDYVLSVEARTIAVGDGGDSEKMRIALGDKDGNTKSIADPGAVAMYYAIDLEKCISLGGRKYLVVIEGAGNDRQAISLSNLKINNLQITCPYLDKNAMELIHTAEYETVYSAAIQNVEQITTAAVRSKRVEFNVTLNAEDITDETQIMIYCDGKCIGTVDTGDSKNLNTQKSSEQTCVYTAAFKAPTSKGTYTLVFYANDGQRDSIYGYEKRMKVR